MTYCVVKEKCLVTMTWAHRKKSECLFAGVEPATFNRPVSYSKGWVGLGWIEREMEANARESFHMQIICLH